MRGLLKSLHYTIRLLLKSPGFTVTAVLIIAFAIGTNAAMFSVIDAVLLRPLPYPKPDRLVQIYLTDQGRESGLDYPDYLDICAAQHTLDTLSIVCSSILDLTGKGDAERLHVDFVSAGMFGVTGVPFILGRPFTEVEDIPDGPLLVVLSERFWRSRFNSDPKIIGTNLTLNDRSFQVIGVAPAQVDYWSSCDLYAPINGLRVVNSALGQRDQHIATGIGRLKAGTSLAQAQADLDIIHDNLSARYSDTDKGYGIRVVSPLDNLVSNFSATIWLLGAAVGCLLLVSCANVANLLFARALERRKEMTIRSALGASRLRLIGQLLLETAFLSMLGGIVGVFVALWTIAIVKALIPQDLYALQYRFQGVTLDSAALLFAFVVTALTSLLSGCLPAWRLSEVDVGSALKDEGGRASTIGPQRQRTQSFLVVAQVALACVLLTAAGLLTRSFQAAQNMPLGLNPHHILTAELYLTSAKYKSDGPRIGAFWDAVLQKARHLPGVTAAAMNDYPPFYWELSWGFASQFSVVGQPDPGPGRQPKLDWHTVSPGYFQALQIPLLQGRDFGMQDKVDSQRVVIIDEALAQSFFPSQNPLGKQITVNNGEDSKACTIVGVVPNVRYAAPDYQQTRFHAYFLSAQYNYEFQILILRSRGDPALLIPGLRKLVASIDPEIPVDKIDTLDASIAKKFVTRRLGVILASLFSAIALFLSAIGLYGVLAYSVSLRSREIGVRIAAGANSGDILRLIVQQGLKIVSTGLVIGILASLVLARLIEGILFGVSATDPVALGVAVVVLCLAALLACLFPALHAVRINPITALRE
jgi:putative ABC transport system permease protein